jgi:hypothetical protein
MMAWKGLVGTCVEATPDFTSQSVFALSASTMVQELYQLLALFSADKAIVSKFEKGMTVLSSREDPLDTLRLRVLEPLATKLLVETAVKNRWRADAIIETMPVLASGKRMDGPWLVQVGRLRIKRSWKRLSLRDGCNKIIHAQHIEPEFRRGANSIPVLTGLIKTTGKQGKASWVAEINIYNYVRASLFNFYGGIDFPRGWLHV